MKTGRTYKHQIGTVLFRTLVLLSVILVSSGSSFERSRSKNIDVYLGGGVSVPTGDLDNGWNLGFHGTGRIGLSVAPKLDILFGIDFHRFSLDVPPGVSGVRGGDVTTILFAGDLKIDLGAPVTTTNPYLIGGIGISVASISDLKLSRFSPISTDSETNFLVEVGGGIEFAKIFIQAKFVNIFAKGSSISYIPITLGVML